MMARAPDGSEDIFDIVGVHDDKVVINMNLPLAGQTLRFEVKVFERWERKARW